MRSSEETGTDQECPIESHEALGSAGCRLQKARCWRQRCNQDRSRGRSRVDPGHIQGGSRPYSGWIQGRFRADPGKIQGGSKADPGGRLTREAGPINSDSLIQLPCHDRLTLSTFNFSNRNQTPGVRVPRPNMSAPTREKNLCVVCYKETEQQQVAS